MFIAKIPALAAAAAVCLLALSTPGLAAEMRPATRAEIVKHLGPNAAGKTAANGFTYKNGSAKGYKVTNGNICIRSPNGSTGCAKIMTDGSSFKMISAGGSTANF